MNICVLSQKPYAEILIPKIMILGDGAYGSREEPHDGISTLIKGAQRALLPLPPCEDMRSLQLKRGASLDYAGTLTSDFQHPEL